MRGPRQSNFKDRRGCVSRSHAPMKLETQFQPEAMFPPGSRSQSCHELHFVFPKGEESTRVEVHGCS